MKKVKQRNETGGAYNYFGKVLFNNKIHLVPPDKIYKVIIYTDIFKGLKDCVTIGKSGKKDCLYFWGWQRFEQALNLGELKEVINGKV